MALGADRRRLRGQAADREPAGRRRRWHASALLVSVWGVAIVERVLPASLGLFAGANDRVHVHGDAMAITLDWRVLLFALCATVATGLLFGAMPARQASDVSAHDVLRETRTTGGVRARTRKLLVVAQLAIAVILLVAAGLLLRSVARLHAIDPGFDRERRPHAAHGAVVRSRIRRRRRAQRFYDAVVERVRRAAGRRVRRLRRRSCR